MSKILKRSLFAIATIVTLLIIATFTLTYFVSPAFIKKEAITWFDQHTDRTLQINSDLHWSFLPPIGLTADNIIISNPRGFPDEPFATAKSVKLNLKIVPLLHQQIAIRKLRLNLVTLNLIKNKRGVENWKFNIHGDDNTDEGYRINVNKIALTNSTINYRDMKTARKIRFGRVNLSSSSININKPFTLSGNAHISAKNPTIDSYIEINGKAEYDDKSKLLTVKDFELSSNHTNDPIRTFSVHTTGEINFSKATFLLKPIEFEYAKSMTGRGGIQGANLYKKPIITGHISTNTFDLKTLLDNIGKPIHTTSNKAFRSVRLEGSFTASANNVKLENLKIRVDNTVVETDINYDLKKNSAAINLKGASLDLSDFAMTSSNSNNKKKTNNTPKISGQFTFNTIKAGDIVLKNVNANFNFTGGVLKLSPISADIFGGKSKGSLILNTNQKQLGYKLNQTMSNINIGNMLGTLFSARPLTGTAQVNIDVSGMGTSANAIRRNLIGTARINAKNGVVHGVDIDYQFAKAFAFLNKSRVAKGDTRQSAFKTTSADIQINKGMITNKAFSMTLPKYHLRGSGSVNLLNQNIDYDLGIKSLTAALIVTPLSKTNLADYHIPLHIGGTLSDPTPSMDLPGLAKITLQEAAKQVITRPVNGTGEVIGKVLNSPVGEVITKPVTETLKKILPFK